MSQAGAMPSSFRKGRRPIIAGDRYNLLTAIEFVRRDEKSRVYWRFVCGCGNEVITLVVSVRNGNTKSCGCLALAARARTGRANASHSLYGSPEYISWAGMLYRCRDVHNADYGGRGIKVCERWLKFENFYADMGPRPSPKHSIDRKDNDGDYEPGNCHWATDLMQARNQRRNRLVTYRGREMTLAEACELAGVRPKSVSRRLSAGWTIDRALSTPTR